MFHCSRTVSKAMAALRQNLAAFPEDSTEYFPSTQEIKMTLKHFYKGAPNLRTITKQGYGSGSAHACAAGVLGALSGTFDRENLPHMGQWFQAASESLIAEL